MFGIGLPEFILIMIIALLVVGPDKLPELARTLAKYVVELKKAANSLKQSLSEEETEHPWDKSPRDFTLPEGFSSATGITPPDREEEAGEAEPADTAPAQEFDVDGDGAGSEAADREESDDR